MIWLLISLKKNEVQEYICTEDLGIIKQEKEILPKYSSNSSLKPTNSSHCIYDVLDFLLSFSGKYNSHSHMVLNP